jgi:hypothetical protein
MQMTAGSSTRVLPQRVMNWVGSYARFHMPTAAGDIEYVLPRNSWHPHWAILVSLCYVGRGVEFQEAE